MASAEIVQAAARAMSELLGLPSSQWVHDAEAVLAAVEPLIELRATKQYAEWLNVWEGRIRADQDRKTRSQVASDIWADEQKCLEATFSRPTDAHLNGRMLGLQRARDIAEGR